LTVETENNGVMHIGSAEQAVTCTQQSADDDFASLAYESTRESPETKSQHKQGLDGPATQQHAQPILSHVLRYNSPETPKQIGE
jgi:hypothetical protein